MKEASTVEQNPSEAPQIRVKLRTRPLQTANHHDPPRQVVKSAREPFVIRLKDREMRAADDASLATQFAV